MKTFVAMSANVLAFLLPAADDEKPAMTPLVEVVVLTTEAKYRIGEDPEKPDKLAMLKGQRIEDLRFFVEHPNELRKISRKFEELAVLAEKAIAAHNLQPELPL